LQRECVLLAMQHAVLKHLLLSGALAEGAGLCSMAAAKDRTVNLDRSCLASIRGLRAAAIGAKTYNARAAAILSFVQREVAGTPAAIASLLDSGFRSVLQRRMVSIRTLLVLNSLQDLNIHCASQ
jgi:hypothetical protein